MSLSTADKQHIEALERKLEREGGWKGTPRKPGEPIQVHIDADVKNVVHKYPYASNVLPRKLPGCEHDAKGKPIIQNRQHERNICARYGYERD